MVKDWTTDEALDKLCLMTQPVVNILTDKDFSGELRRRMDPGEVKTAAERIVFGAEKITKLIPMLMKDHRNDLYEIIAVYYGLDAQTVAGQLFFTTARQVRDMVKDKELLAFFRSWVDTEGSE